MGTNGISFYQHASSYMPAVLVYKATLTKPLVLLMEYNNKTPNLYINGTLVKAGLTSTKTVLLPSITIDANAYGVMSSPLKYPFLNPNPQTFHQNIFQNTKNPRNYPKNP